MAIIYLIIKKQQQQSSIPPWRYNNVLIPSSCSKQIEQKTKANFAYVCPTIVFRCTNELVLCKLSLNRLVIESTKYL